MSAISTLVSMIKTEKALSNISSTNISSANIEGYACKNADVLSLNTDGRLGGSTLSRIYNTIDPILQSQTRKENSIYSKQQVTDQFYQKLNLMFGSKGTQTSFVHNLGRFTSSMREITTNPDLTKKTQAVSDAVTFANQINDVVTTVKDLRGSTDQMLANAIDRINTLIQQITDINQKISSLSMSSGGSPITSGYVDVTSFENQRDNFVQELSGLVDINIFKTDENKYNISLAGSGRTLVQGNYNYKLDYTVSTSVVPGQTLSPITYLGVDITAEIAQGQVAGLIDMRDTVLVNAQQEFDELTRSIRDTVNALHNQGASLRGASTLAGTTSVPGLGTQLLSTTPISGTGTVRIGVIDNLGTIKDYKDIALTDGMTIGSLVSNITGTNYNVSSGTVAATGGDFTFTQLSSGAIQIQSTANNTIVIGAAGPVQPMLSLGSTYSASAGLGFSHFLGLNNFFVTGDDLASSASQIGIANKLQVRPDIVSNSSYLAVGTLSNDVPVSQLPGGALGNRKTDIADQIQTQLSKGNISFLTAGQIPANTGDAQSYATQIMSMMQGDINQSSKDLKLYESIYTQLAALAAQKTSVDVSDELIKIYNISNSQQLASKALSLTLEMQKSVINII